MKRYQRIRQRSELGDTVLFREWREKKLWLAITAYLETLTPVPNEWDEWWFTDKPEGIKLTEDMYHDPVRWYCWFRVDEKLTGGNPEEAWVFYEYYPLD